MIVQCHVCNISTIKTAYNKLDFKNFKWSRHDYGSAKWGLGGIQEDSKVAKNMVMCFHFVEGWRFASYLGGLGIRGYSMHATKHGSMHGHCTWFRQVVGCYLKYQYYCANNSGRA